MQLCALIIKIVSPTDCTVQFIKILYMYSNAQISNCPSSMKKWHCMWQDKGKVLLITFTTDNVANKTTTNKIMG